MDRFARRFGFVLLSLFAVAIVMGLCRCVSAPPREASIEEPLTGCIMPTLRQSGAHEGKLLPEPVRMIGKTPIDDGHRWMVTRGPDFNPNKWEPHNDAALFPNDPGAIHFGAICGPEVKALDEIFSASRGDGAAARYSHPPR
jgi:hypothetical protein